MHSWLTTGRFWLVVIAAAFLLRLPALNNRFYSNDEASYSAIAARLVDGGTMYVDAIDHKPPAIAWLYAGVFRVAGLYQLVWLRVLLALTVGITGICIAELAASLTGDEIARIAGLVYVALSVTGFAPNTQAANTELFLNLPLTLAAIAMLKQSHSTHATRAFAWSLGAGVATAVAALFKYQSALAGVAWLLAVFVPRRAPKPLSAVAGLAVGFGGVITALLLGFLISGHLDAFLFWGWRYNFQYIASMPFDRQLVRFVLEALPVAAGWLPALLLLAFARRQHLAIAWLWFGGMAAAVCVGGRFFGNYFLMLAPPLAVLAGAALPSLRSERPRLVRPFAAGTLILAILSVVAVPIWDRLVPSTALDDARYRDAAEWIASHSKDGDRLLVWGDSAQIYVYSRRRMGTRFAFTNYQTGTIWGTGAIPGMPGPTMPARSVPRAWDELLADMQHDPPSLIADAAAGGLHNFGGLELEQFPQLWTIVHAHYRYETTRAGIRMYRHNPE